MLTHFPAVIIGGPPHSGKSVLVYSLTRALRQARVPHYVLRACPDGEGDWSNEADQGQVRAIRVKGAFTPDFTQRLAGYLQKRHLPLLIDVGGRPTTEQEALFSHCTHAILLIGANDPAAYEQHCAVWETMMARQGVKVIARLKSVVPGEDALEAASPIVSGTLANLERGQTAAGPVVAALVATLSELFNYTEAELTALHLAQAPVELTLDLPALSRTLGSADGRWRPAQLPDLIDYLPIGKALALYGRSVNWVNACLAMLSYPAPIWLYDVRLGWVQPPELSLAEPPEPQPGWAVSRHDEDGFTRLEMKTHAQYLDIDEPDRLPLPDVPATKGLVLSGQIPHWLTTAVTRRLAPHVLWTAVYQPPLGAAVVVHTQDTTFPIGQTLPITPADS